MNDLLKKASNWFTDCGIRVQEKGQNCLKVHRQDMFDAAKNSDNDTKEQVEHTVLKDIRNQLSCNKYSWFQKDSDWCYLETF